VARTGGFGEESCRECHWENPLNDGGVAVLLSGLPGRIAPAAVCTLTVTLRRADMQVAGFQLSVRFDDGPERGKQAGVLRSIDSRTQVTRSDSTGVSYISQTRAGTALSTAGSAVWRFEWSAPQRVASPIVFHVAANAANDNNSEGGDYVYVLSRKVEGPG
jgi:hypothetical protein